jgi:hypothetical protein
MHKKFMRFFLLTVLPGIVALTIAQSVCAQTDTAKKPHTFFDPRPRHDTIATGVSISPGKIKFTVKPGGTESHIVKVTNNTNSTFDFQTSFSDYFQNTRGQPIFNSPAQPKSKYGLAQFATVSPALFKLLPGKSQKLTVTVTLPNADSVNHAAWTVLEVDKVSKKKPVPVPGANDNSLQMGIIPSFGFGVYLYQNPPDVKVNSVEILNFSYHDTAFTAHGHDSVLRQLYLKITNTGDGIGYCVSYAEITNLSTGKTVRLGSKDFSILPGFTREFFYDLPKDTKSSNYSAIGVVYFGEKVPKKVAQLNFFVR